MTTQDHPKFLELISAMAEIYHEDLTKLKLEIYWTCLMPFSFGDFEKAVTNVARRWKANRLPSPAEFIEEICPPEDAEAKAELALEEFFERFADSGYHSFTWRDPVLAMSVQHYDGWRNVLDTYPRGEDQETDRTFRLKDFKAIYKFYLKHPRPSKMRFVGLLEAENKALGYICQDNGEPVLAIDGNGEKVPLLADSEEGRKYLAIQERKLIEEDDIKRDSLEVF